MKLLLVLDPHKGESYHGPDPMLQGQFGVVLGTNPNERRRIYVLEVEAAFEVELSADG